MWIKQFESITYVVMQLGHIFGLELFPKIFLSNIILGCYAKGKGVKRSMSV